ncbi:MAG: DUF2807 domain-containing protein [Bacteroidota bacterium]
MKLIKEIAFRMLPLILLLSSCEGLLEDSGDCLRPQSQEISIKSFNLSAFQKLHIKGELEVLLVQGDNYKLEIRGSENLIENLVVKQDQQTLNIQPKQCMHHTGRLYLFLQAPKLSEIRLYESTYLTGDIWRGEQISLYAEESSAIDMELEVISVNTYVRDASNICLRGVAEKHVGSVLGKSSTYAGTLVSQEADFTVSGERSSATLLVSNRLEANVKNGGTLFYAGHPPTVKALVDANSDLLLVD